MPILSISRARALMAVAIVLALGPARARAQQPVMPAFTAGKGAFVGLSVADLDASVKWYTEKLGLAVVMRPPTIEKSTAAILEVGA